MPSPRLQKKEKEKEKEKEKKKKKKKRKQKKKKKKKKKKTPLPPPPLINSYECQCIIMEVGITFKLISDKTQTLSGNIYTLCSYHGRKPAKSDTNHLCSSRRLHGSVSR